MSIVAGPSQELGVTESDRIDQTTRRVLIDRQHDNANVTHTVASILQANTAPYKHIYVPHRGRRSGILFTPSATTIYTTNATRYYRCHTHNETIESSNTAF